MVTNDKIGVIFDFKDGSTLQCACETPQGQAAIFNCTYLQFRDCFSKCGALTVTQLCGKHTLSTRHDDESNSFHFILFFSKCLSTTCS